MTKSASGVRKKRTRGLEVSVASQRRKQIVAAARACITEEGVERLTLRGVAERAQVSHATVAHYFHTRRELIDAALLAASEELMDVLRQRNLVYGPRDLEELVETFLDASNPTARFVVQMIDAGLHDLQLRNTHQEFVQYGRERIERSIRVGMETGVYRDDVDPKLAAALLHTMLIWWQSELAAGATERELALAVGRLTLTLLTRKGEIQAWREWQGLALRADLNGDAPTVASPLNRSTTELIESALLSDPRLSPRAARLLVDALNSMYELATGASLPGSAS